jgi:MOSC domain-containing protein YiiM
MQGCPRFSSGVRDDVSVHAGSVVQINISQGGVPKLPVAEARVTSLGIDGDLHNNPSIHGGPRKALLWITSEGLDELTTSGFPLYAGALGENLTTRGVDRHSLRIGQRWQIGRVVIELTRIRTPCKTISIYGPGIGEAVYDQDVKAGDAASPRWGLAGFYADVLEPGHIRTGDAVALLE